MKPSRCMISRIKGFLDQRRLWGGDETGPSRLKEGPTPLGQFASLPRRRCNIPDPIPGTARLWRYRDHPAAVLVDSAEHLDDLFAEAQVEDQG